MIVDLFQLLGSGISVTLLLCSERNEETGGGATKKKAIKKTYNKTLYKPTTFFCTT